MSTGGLGFLPGGHWSVASGISADGLVVIGSSTVPREGTGSFGSLRAFRWERGTMSALPSLAKSSQGEERTDATAVNIDGSIIVGYGISASDRIQALRWIGSSVTGLGFLTGGDFSEAAGASADGSIVVGIASNGSNDEAFRWSSQAAMTGLGFLQGHCSSRATGVSADGSTILGYSARVVDGARGDGTNPLFRMSPRTRLLSSLKAKLNSRLADQNADVVAVQWVNGTISALDNMPGGGGDAIAISADGSVVIGSMIDSAGRIQGFRWVAGTMTGLGFLPGGTITIPTVVNENGTVIAGMADTTHSGSIRSVPFVWTQQNGIQPISENCQDQDTWISSAARGISADGQSIVGFRQNRMDSTEAWLWAL